MPLISRDFGGVERVEMPDGDWYELRRELGWYHRQKISDVAGIVINLPGNRLKSDQNVIADDDVIPATVANRANVIADRFMAYIARWSHTNDNGQPIAITSATVKLIPPAHAKILLDKIEALQALQDGPHDGDPLAENSNGSSGAPSSTAGGASP